MTKPTDSQPALTKSSYTRPSLEVFGTVRNLTGGSGTMMMDGMVAMSMS